MTDLEAGPETDALVAEKVMRWTRELDAESLLDFWHQDDGYTPYRVNDGHGSTPDMWCPSTDIAAAWEVVEKLRDEDWTFSIGWDGDVWYCNGSKQEIRCDDCGHMGSSEIHANASTAPLAICRAALKAVGAVVD